jgi:hypothetical protein
MRTPVIYKVLDAVTATTTSEAINIENADKVKFMGIIKQVMPNGLLQIELDEDTLRLFDIKELKMLY